MATIQELLRAKQSKPLQDILDKYNQGGMVQHYAEGTDGGVPNLEELKKIRSELENNDSKFSKYKDLPKPEELTESLSEPSAEVPTSGLKGNPKVPYNMGENDISNSIKNSVEKVAGPAALMGELGGAAGLGALAFEGGKKLGENTKEYVSNHPEIRQDEMGNFISNYDDKNKSKNGPVDNVPDDKELKLGEEGNPDPELVKKFIGATGDDNDDNDLVNQVGARSPRNPLRPPEVMTGNQSPAMVVNTEPTPATAPNNLQSLLDAYKGTEDTHRRDLASAQGAANKNELYSNLARGLAQLNSGITGNSVTGPAKVNTTGLDAIQKNAQAPIEQYKQNLENEKNDPNSSYSKGLQQFISPTMEKLGIKNQGPLSGAIVEKIAPWLVSEYNKKIAADATAAKAATLSKDRQDKADDKDSEKSDKAYTDLTQKYNTFRGNQEVQQSATALRNIKNAQSLIAQGNLTPEYARMLATEISKIASGGVPTEAGVKELIPHNAQTQLAKFSEFLTSNPSPVQQKEWMKVHGQYLGELLKNSQGIVDEYHADMYRGYRGRISDDNAKEFLVAHPEMQSKFPEEVKKYNLNPTQNSQPAQKNQHKPGDVITVKSTGKQYKVGADGNTLDPI